MTEFFGSWSDSHDVEEVEETVETVTTTTTRRKTVVPDVSLKSSRPAQVARP